MSGDTIYFARNRRTGAVKIGHSWAVDRRVTRLSRVAGVELELVATTPGGRRIEGRLHAHLIDSHLGGEWFRPSARLDRVLAAIRAGTFDPATLPGGPSPIRSASARDGHAARRLRLEAA